MNIRITHTTTQPLFGQIYDQLHEQIRNGTLPPGCPLPSIRALAKELSVSVITIKRAYDELERDGLIHTVAGKGCYVAKQNDILIREKALNALQDHLRQALRLAPDCGMSTEAIIMLIRMMDTDNQQK